MKVESVNLPSHSVEDRILVDKDTKGLPFAWQTFLYDFVDEGYLSLDQSGEHHMMVGAEGDGILISRVCKSHHISS